MYQCQMESRHKVVFYSRFGKFRKLHNRKVYIMACSVISKNDTL